MIINIPDNSYLVAIDLKVYAMSESDYQEYLSYMEEVYTTQKFNAQEEYLINYQLTHKCLFELKDLSLI